MADYYTNKDDKLSFKEIALGHYKRILEITTTEFAGGHWKYIQTGNSTNKEYVTDKRQEFIQAVESLANALYPHFDVQMKKDYKNYLEKKKKLFAKYQEGGFITSKNKMPHSIKMLNVMKQLFRKLSCLMYRLDYFKSATYTEGDIEDIKEIDGREENDTL